MCTGLLIKGGHPFFGRNLDLDIDYGSFPILVERGHRFSFFEEGERESKYALIGSGILSPKGLPLFFDAMNEKGLALAGLNFPGNAKRFPKVEGKLNLAPHELFYFLLGNCASIAEARAFLDELSLLDRAPEEGMPIAELHYLLADPTGALVFEPTSEGVKVYDDPFGVLTNNPPFPYQVENLRRYLNLQTSFPGSTIEGLAPTSVGMGAIGLPGDYSSSSRFAKAAFLNANLPEPSSEEEALSSFFSILDAVAFVPGIAYGKDGKAEKTVYQAAYELKSGHYYVRSSPIEAPRQIDLSALALDGGKVVSLR